MRLWTVAFAIAAFAQDGYLDRWQALRSAQPPGLHLEISSANTAYYLGEPIALEVEYRADPPVTLSADSRLQDRIGRLNGVELFLVDPAADAEDPLDGLVFGAGGLGGLSGGPVSLAKPFRFPRVLNDWVRFRKPGRYRIYAIGRRVPGQEAISNVLTLTITPAPEAWVQQQIAAGDENALRYLDTPEAAFALARRLSAGASVTEFQSHLGVLGSRHRARLLPFLEERLVAPDQAVWTRYLDTLQRLEALVRPGRKTDYAARLQAALPNKRGAARAVCLQTLVALQRPVPVGWLAESLPHLPEQEQLFLLTHHWNELRSEGMLPVLRRLYALPRGPLPGVALRRIYELAPEEGRQLVLAQLRQPDKQLEWESLSLLPEKTLPALDAALALRAESGDLDDRPIVRYATDAILERVRRVYAARPAGPGCSLLLPFYFLKYDPSFGESELRRLMQRPACFDIAYHLRDVAQSGMSPALERIAISLLESPLVPVKQGAAQALGRYGSAAAQAPLWNTLVYFQNWWKGREAEIGQDGIAFERALRAALGQGEAWVLTPAEWERLWALCSTDVCRRETGQWTVESGPPVRIAILPWGDSAFEVGPYRGFGETALLRRLRLYPPKTVFRIDPNTPAPGRIWLARGLRLAGHVPAP